MRMAILALATLLPLVRPSMSLGEVDGGNTSATSARPTTGPSLVQERANLRVPPEWMASIPVDYDTRKPWKEARLAIRSLLGRGDLLSRRQAIKLAYHYRQTGDIGDGSEFTTYLFLGGEMAWATAELESFIAGLEAQAKSGYTEQYLYLASCYRHYGLHDRAVNVVQKALQRPPQPPWDVPAQAHAYEVLGDCYLDAGDTAKAREAYQQAMTLYPQSKQPWGRHLLPRRVEKIQAKLDIVSMDSIDVSKLREGQFTGESEGYVDRVIATVTIRGGKIADIQFEHKENIPLDAFEVVPERIVSKQSLKVDAVTGATTTSDAIRHATLDALRKAGLP